MLDFANKGNHAIVYNGMVGCFNGTITYKESLELIVVAQAKVIKDLEERLIEMTNLFPSQNYIIPSKKVNDG